MSRCHGSKISGWKQTENVAKTWIRTVSNYIDFFYLSNVGEIFLGLNPKGPYLSLEKDNENSMLCSPTLLNGRVKLGSGGFMS